MKFSQWVKWSLLFLLLPLLSLPGCASQGEKGSEAPDPVVQEALSAAETYRELLTEKEGCAMPEILSRLEEQGYTAGDVAGEYAFVNAEKIRELFAQKDTENPLRLAFLQVCEDGGLIDTHIFQRGGAWMCESARVAWEQGEATLTYVHSYPVTALKLSAKDTLIFTCEIPDNTAESDHDGYIEPTTLLRLSPADSICRGWNERVVSRIGYRGNNLYTSNWSQDDLSALCFNEVFAALYRAETGRLLSYFDNPYPTGELRDITYVPKDAFEELIFHFFDLSSEKIAEHAQFDRETNSYPVEIQSLHGPAQTPVPEVVQVSEGADGTITLTVDAVFVEGATDCAFTHVLTLRPAGDGGYFLLSNEILQVYSGDPPATRCLIP